MAESQHFYNGNELRKQLQAAGFVGDETLMIHSAFSRIKNIEGGAEGFLAVLKSYFAEGLLLFPTHTWASMKEDGCVMDKRAQNSCVGYLTNVAIADPDFLRSNHPTHSVVGCGRNAEAYLRDDDDAQTPVSPTGSFGKLKENGWLWFIGCPLSKNTFVHSIEEEMNVPDRFTEHVYTFYTEGEKGRMEFHMPRHFSTKNPHISDNYEKLLPFLLTRKIARPVTLCDCTTYLVKAPELHEFVLQLLKKDLHCFDDLRDLQPYL